MKNVILLLLINSFSLSVFSYDLCSSVDAKNLVQCLQPKIEILFPSIDNFELKNYIADKDFLNFIDVVYKNRDLFGGLPIASSEATDLVEGFNPSYNQKFKALTLLNLSKNLSTAIKQLPIMIHEFAHSVFEPNVKHYLNSEIANTQSNDLLRLTTRNDLLPASIKTLADPFHELIADTFSVLALENPTCISDWLKTSGEAEDRNFLIDYSFDSWNKGDLGGALISKGHSVFNPMRHLIWQTYINTNENDRDIRKRIFQSLVNSSLEMIKEFASLKITFQEWTNYSKSDLNKKLREKFLKNLN